MPCKEYEVYCSVNKVAMVLLAVRSAESQLCSWDFENSLVISYMYDILPRMKADL